MVNLIKKNRVLILCMLILGVYCTWMLIINFSGNPIFYDADMYSDMLYSVKAWEHKSIFPEGWVFGNQLYAVATPVLAALFYGLTGSMCNAMAIASTVMGAGVMLSFCWMLKPVLQKRDERWIALTFFLTLVLAVGDIYHEDNGWQLLFTMCSYYACYAISAFLAFGCWLRSDLPRSPGSTAMLLLACLMAFGTGIQSLRQTAIMICPLIGLELLRLLFLVIRKEKICFRSLLITGLLTAANLAGVLCAKFAAVEQVEIYGAIELLPISTWPSELMASLFGPSTLLSGERSALLLYIVYASLPPILYFPLRDMVHKKQWKVLTLLAPLLVSIAVILVIDICTSMYVRSIYYFLLFPVLAILLAYLYKRSGKTVRIAVLALLLVVFAFNCSKTTSIVANSGNDTLYEEVADYLEGHAISTIYSEWGLACKISVASEGKLEAGFWQINGPPFNPVDYLCNPEIHHADSASCAYILFSDDVPIALQTADGVNVNLSLLKHFPKSDICIYTSDRNIMELFLASKSDSIAPAAE